MTIFTVSNTNDAGAGSLRDAILGANQSSGLDNILFDIPGMESHTIQLASALPDITDQVIIDGTTQSEFGGMPSIELNGANAGTDVNGLTITRGGRGSTIRGLAIHSFSGSGISLNGSDDNKIVGNYIGTDITGTMDLGNQGNGISLENGASDNLIGGGLKDTITSTSLANVKSLGVNGNLILGNDGDGIALTGRGTKNNQIEGNYIGTDVQGKAALGNDNGISLNEGASRNNIADNLISGNKDNGIKMIGRGTKHNLLKDNYIGTDATGTIALGNENEGIKIKEGASKNLIGTGDFRDRNLISGNVDDGVDIGGEGTRRNEVKGNYIGTDITGTKALGNDDGIQIKDGSSKNIVAGNIVSGNLDDGIPIADPGTVDNLVINNYIGIDISGTKALGNGDDGLAIDDGAGRNFVISNIISGNVSDGVEIQGTGARKILVAGNYIGTDATGAKALGNGTDGVDIDAGASKNIITRNVISNNGETGIEMNDKGTTKNLVTSNFIGTDATGTMDMGNAEDGIIIFDGASGNIIGDTKSSTSIPNKFKNYPIRSQSEKLLFGNTPSLLRNDSLIGKGNLIHHNGGDGVLIADMTSSGNTISRNSIYDNAGLGIDLSYDSTRDGLTPNDIGDIDTGANNLQNNPVIESISSGDDGIELTGKLNSLPRSSYKIEFFSSPNAENSDEGANFLGSVNLRTDKNGDANFDFSTDDIIVKDRVITATATNRKTGDTSEFSSAAIFG
ncbi:right-handed parallel beta-helix repeat-containing protein [Mastigocoleus sp. MO_188.B34]|uniref:right-handed parallel beta-helix repeat-containing protein n=1 Tax=Mastigocoleus sp. MO_188.B34 TaxID=3036635 RepID=UPI00260CFCD0|nr:right-handed parallel beta-helix repeat-containing protein [Mastigocoleus sp. MO_188.B34]MDJ0696270.1 right-handed parallel beta-helix repeat-containing protein [Mastigocoleus sp. MO_188.B34]